MTINQLIKDNEKKYIEANASTFTQNMEISKKLHEFVDKVNKDLPDAWRVLGDKVIEITRIGNISFMYVYNRFNVGIKTDFKYGNYTYDTNFWCLSASDFELVKNYNINQVATLIKDLIMKSL